ncbi:hypothetical protein CEP51_015017 [Fusarium floridanum]|uniref:Uncharacterized protein n=1 Tax=Fusarium floridanum TaxID=1325733 RepID=A0A428PI16_9HYPO|nr:hypothetical protein CEP51_015017 [Fusarium floridanum]
MHNSPSFVFMPPKLESVDCAAGNIENVTAESPTRCQLIKVLALGPETPGTCPVPGLAHKEPHFASPHLVSLHQQPEPSSITSIEPLSTSPSPNFDDDR